MEYNCDECSRNYLLPPPEFVLPPPPIPPSLKNLVLCNDEKLLIQINNWEHDMCGSIPIFEESILSGPSVEQALILVGIFACILLIVIVFYILYVKRLVNQQNNGCKEFKTLVKHTLQHSDFNSSDSHTMYLDKFQYDNFYKRFNQYTIRQAQDFINYVPTNNMANPIFTEYQNCHEQIKSPNSIVVGDSYNIEPTNYSGNNYDNYLININVDKNYNTSKYCLTDYVQSASLIRTSGTVTDRGFISHTPSLIEYQHDLYSIAYKDFDELTGYSRTDTGYGGSEGDNTEPSSSQGNKSQNSKRSSIDSDFEMKRYSQTSINRSYPEYVDIELTLPKLISK